MPQFASLNQNIKTDVCIVGAGIAGLTCAYTLAKKGKSVVVIDKGSIGGGQTCRTTGHLTWVLDDRYSDLEKLFGENGARQAAESHSDAIDYVERIVDEEKIDCDFERLDGYLFAPPNESQEVLENEFAAIQRIGKEVYREKKAPFSPSFDTGPCLRFPGQAEFHVLKYLQGLVSSIIKLGGKIYTNTHATGFLDGPPCIVETSQGFKITSEKIIVATCTPVNNRFFIHTKQAAYRTYVIAAKIPPGYVQKGIYWDTPDPYHYIRTQKDLSSTAFEWLIVGGEDHKTGQCKYIEEKYHDLAKWAKTRFPDMEKVEYHWSGQIYEPIDSLAFIGRNSLDNNIYIVTGDSGNGLTHGTLAGILLPDLILGIDNQWKELYHPSRISSKAIGEFVNENVNAFSQYRDWFTPGEIKEIDALPVNEGIILREGVEKIAVYRDAENKIHAHSAFCPHLGACLRWNQGEKSWDCPAHGSRFDGCGNVLCGPANSSLPKKTLN